MPSIFVEVGNLRRRLAGLVQRLLQLFWLTDGQCQNVTWTVNGTGTVGSTYVFFAYAIHLVASHCKLWRDSSNDERLNGENGLLLTPSIDHLFDRGFIGFEDSGDLIVSPVAHKPSLKRMGFETKRVVNVGGFTEGQRRFLDFHRNAVLLKAVR